jgi:hypothetical protein
MREDHVVVWAKSVAERVRRASAETQMMRGDFMGREVIGEVLIILLHR